MKIIRIDTIEVEVNDERVVRMMECVTMETNQEILIRNKKDAQKLSKQIAESSKQMRYERYLEALEDNDRLYLNNIYDSLSTLDLLRMLCNKIKKHI